MLSLSPAHAAKARRYVNLEWEPVEDATQYEVTITRIRKGGERAKPSTFKVGEAKWRGQINPGKYEMLLRSYDDRGVPGGWSEPVLFLVKNPPPARIYPTPDLVIETKEASTFDVEFQWQSEENDSGFRLDIESTTGDFKKSYKVSGTSKEVDLPVANTYKWRVTALMDADEEVGEMSEAMDSFTLKGQSLDKPTIKTPMSSIVETLSWKRPEHAEHYSYVLSTKKPDGKWSVVDKNESYQLNNLPFDLSRPAGEYRLKVMAHAHNRETSSDSIEFTSAGNLRNPAAIEAAKLKESLNKPTPFYFIASYFLTNMAYRGANFQESSGPTDFSAIGGTGRLGMGYIHPRSSWGLFAIADMSGFTVVGETYTFLSTEVHGTWTKDLPGANRLQVTGGFYSKDLPEAIGTASIGSSQGTFSKMNTLTAYGAHGGVIYQRPISSRLGIELNARVYLPIEGDNPNGVTPESTLSYQLGILGSLKLNDRTTGYAGYSRRLDTHYYRAQSTGSNPVTEGTNNEVEIEGNYLNLKLEYSF